MMIKEGYNDKETRIAIQEENGRINLYIEHSGMEGRNETLCFLTPDELYKLFIEVKTAGRDLFC
jgi:hypothetical protein